MRMPCKHLETRLNAPPVSRTATRYAQKWFLDFCDAITNADDATSTRMVYEADASVPAPVMCPLESMKTWYVRLFFSRGRGGGVYT